MKRLLVLVAGAALAVGLYATTAGGGGQAVTPSQFAALKKQVAALKKDVNTLKARNECLTAVSVGDYGDGQASGYHFKQPDGSEILTSALDLTAEGETPTGYLAGIDSKCVTSLRYAHLRLGKTTNR